MISIIICSRTHDISAEMKSNVTATIGCDYEFVIIDNSRGGYNIFSAYNEGIRRANGDILCFAHDDILFKTENWGKIVDDILGNEDIGLVGVAGGHFLGSCPAPWWASRALAGQVNQGCMNDGQYIVSEDRWWSRRDSGIIDVATVDGLFMCLRKEMFDSVRFDEETYCHFHCYDCDICMQVQSASKRVVVSYDIIVEHRSFGVADLKFFEQLDLWADKWKNSLPIARGVDWDETEINERNQICEEYSSFVKEREQIRRTKRYILADILTKPFRR